jgi:hypothetical protein
LKRRTLDLSRALLDTPASPMRKRAEVRPKLPCMSPPATETWNLDLCPLAVELVDAIGVAVPGTLKRRVTARRVLERAVTTRNIDLPVLPGVPNSFWAPMPWDVDSGPALAHAIKRLRKGGFTTRNPYKDCGSNRCT